MIKTNSATSCLRVCILLVFNTLWAPRHRKTLFACIKQAPCARHEHKLLYKLTTVAAFVQFPMSQGTPRSSLFLDHLCYPIYL